MLMLGALRDKSYKSEHMSLIHIMPPLGDLAALKIEQGREAVEQGMASGWIKKSAFL